MNNNLRVIIADDERPARSFLATTLRAFEDITLIGEASNGAEAIELIEREAPDLALLDLQMPEIDGLEVVRLVRPPRLPLFAFVTAFDEYAIRAFELNAIDYLLKPVAQSRLRGTINRALERLERNAFDERLTGEAGVRIADAALSWHQLAHHLWLERIPVRRREDIILVPVREIASVVADGELLKLTTINNQVHTITYRLKDLETRLDPSRFIRLGRGTLANISLLQRMSPMPGGTYLATLSNGQQLQVSRLQGRLIRETLLKI